jgi:predicted enzyme related to lactoylglutathione lyase
MTVFTTLNLLVRDATESGVFYARAFGFAPNLDMSAPPHRIVLDAGGGCRLSFHTTGTAGAQSAYQMPANFELDFETDDLSAARRRLEDAGATVLQEDVMAWGRAMALGDPDGFRLVVYELHRHRKGI